jgi:hypothetical protein
VTSVWPITGRSPKRQITVSPSRVTNALMTMTASATGSAIRSARRSARPHPAATPAVSSRQVSAPSAIGSAHSSTAIPTHAHQAQPTAARAACSGVARRR